MQISIATFNSAGTERYAEQDKWIDCSEFTHAIERTACRESLTVSDDKAQALLVELIKANVPDDILEALKNSDGQVTTASIEAYVMSEGTKLASLDPYVRATFSNLNLDNRLAHDELDNLFHIITHKKYGKLSPVPGKPQYSHLEIDKFNTVWNPDFGRKRDERAARCAALKTAIESLPDDIRPARPMLVISNTDSTLGEQYLVALNIKAKHPADYRAYTLQTTPEVLARLNASIVGIDEMPPDALQTVYDARQVLNRAQAAFTRVQNKPDTDPAKISAKAALTSALQAYTTAIAATPKISAKTPIVFGLR